MSQTLLVELSDELFAAVARQAAEANTSPAQIITRSLEQQFRQVRKEQQEHSDEEKQAARERFEQHFGSIDLGYATGSDNESIDNDLAREYANTHEDE